MEYVIQSGVAARSWGIRGEGVKGTGKRSKAKFWKVGVSGKQNRRINCPTEETNNLVSIFFPFYI